MSYDHFDAEELDDIVAEWGNGTKEYSADDKQELFLYDEAANVIDSYCPLIKVTDENGTLTINNRFHTYIVEPSEYFKYEIHDCDCKGLDL